MVSIVHKIQDLMISRNWTLSCAESCTGGLISSKLTGVSGSSSYFLGGVVSYHADLKVNLLRVSPCAIHAHGVVSPEVAGQMALGAKVNLESTWALSTTGIAGPSGGTKEYPVGTVSFGVAGPAGLLYKEKVQFTEKKRLEVQEAASLYSLNLLYSIINS